MSALLLIFKGLFGGIGTIFGKILGDWRILAFVCALLVVGMVGMKIRADQKELANVKATLVQVQKNNETLKQNEIVLKEANQSNQATIEQLQADKKLALESVNNLTQQLQRSNVAFNTIQRKIDEIKTPPTKLSPYLVSAISGIQSERQGVQK